MSELLKNKFVHVVGRRRCFPLKSRHRLYKRKIASFDMVEKPYGYSDLPASGTDDKSVARDCGESFFGTRIHGEPRDVLFRAVVKHCGDAELLGVRRPCQRTARTGFRTDAREARRVVFVKPAALLNPLK